MFHESLKFHIVLVVSEIKSKCHRWINFRKMDLFSCAFVLLQVILFYQLLITRYSVQCVVWV